MKKEKNYISYEVALTDAEILACAQIIDKFKNEEIDFKCLEGMFEIQGMTVTPTLVDFSQRRMTVKEYEPIKKRISEQKYLYKDIASFVLNSNEFHNVIFMLDYKAIEILANFGVSEYQKNLISILKTQLRYSYDKDPLLTAKRRKWRKQITELELQLSKSAAVAKSK